MIKFKREEQEGIEIYRCVNANNGRKAKKNIILFIYGKHMCNEPVFDEERHIYIYPQCFKGRPYRGFINSVSNTFKLNNVYYMFDCGDEGVISIINKINPELIYVFDSKLKERIVLKCSTKTQLYELPDPVLNRNNSTNDMFRIYNFIEVLKGLMSINVYDIDEGLHFLKKYIINIS